MAQFSPRRRVRPPIENHRALKKRESSASAKKKKISKSSRKTAKSSRNAKRPSSVKHFEGFLEGIPDEEVPVEEELEP